MLCVLGELVVDMLPVPDGRRGAGGHGTAVRRATRRQRAQRRRRRRPARHAGPAARPPRAPARWAPTCAGTPSSPGWTAPGSSTADEPVSLAVIGLNPDGSPDYGFHVLGAADWQWTDAELAAVYPERTAILHVGSISSWTAPGCDAIARLVERVHADGSALISVDPNIRPPLADGPVGASLGNTAPVVRERLDRLRAPGRRRQGERRGPRVARAGRARRRRAGRRRTAVGGSRPGPGRAHRRRRPAARSPARDARCCTARRSG